MARPRRIKTLNVHIKIIGRQNVAINNIISATNEIFAQANIAVQFAPVEQLNLSQDELEFLEPMDVGACRRKPSEDQIQISTNRNNAGVKDVVVYICETVMGNVSLGGCATHPRGVPMVVMASQTVNSVLAHELAHLLKLDHCGHDLFNRLMNSSVDDVPPPLVLTESEIRDMRRSSLLS